MTYRETASATRPSLAAELTAELTAEHYGNFTRLPVIEGLTHDAWGVSRLTISDPHLDPATEARMVRAHAPLRPMFQSGACLGQVVRLGLVNDHLTLLVQTRVDGLVQPCALIVAVCLRVDPDQPTSVQPLQGLMLMTLSEVALYFGGDRHFGPYMLQRIWARGLEDDLSPGDDPDITPPTTWVLYGPGAPLTVVSQPLE